MTDFESTLDSQRRHLETKSIVAYYDQTWVDYRIFWQSGNNLSIHFGYSDATTRSHEDALVNMNRVLADRVGIRSGDRVLDAGCGVGGSSFWLAKCRGADVVGISPVHGQVVRAQNTATRSHLSSRTCFVQADYTNTCFPDASFDVVWALESLCHASDKLAFYGEAARLLRPGGRLVIAEYIRTKRPFDAAGERVLHSWLKGWVIPDLSTREEHLGYMSASGFSGIRIEDVTLQTRPSLRRLYNITRWSYPLAVLGRYSGIRSAIQHGNVVGSLNQYLALEQGLWFYGIVSAVRKH